MTLIIPHHLVFHVGDIIFLKNYEFEDQDVDKLMIVLNKNSIGEVIYLTFSFTTSRLEKNRITGLYKNHGCTHLGGNHFYFFDKTKVIGKEGFRFDVDTAIIFRNNIRNDKASKFEKYKPSTNTLSVKDRLLDSELKSLLECVISSSYLRPELKPQLEKVLSDLERSSLNH